MATVFADRVKVAVSGTPGTGAITLGTAVAGYRSFASAGIADQAVVSYVIEDGTSWELGHGTYTSATGVLARTLIYASSAGGTTAISASSAAAVFITLLAEDIAALIPAPAAGGPTPAIVQSITVSNTSTTLTFATTPTVGNLIVVVGSAEFYLTPQAGWTVQASVDNTTSRHQSILTRVVQAGDTATITPYDIHDGGIITGYELSGAGSIASNVAPAWVTTTTATTTFSATLAGVPANAMVIGGYFSDASIIATVPGVSLDQDYVGNFGAQNYAHQPFHLLPAAGSLTFTAAIAGGAPTNAAGGVAGATILAIAISAGTAAVQLPAVSGPPTVVQKVFSAHQTSAGVTLPAAPTPGNLLVALAVNYASYGTNAGWTDIEYVPRSNNFDCPAVMRRVLSTDTAAISSPFNIPNGGDYIVYEIANASTGFVDISAPAWAASTTSITHTTPALPANTLVLGNAASLSSNVPTIPGVTMDGSLGGNSLNGYYDIYPFHVAPAAGALTLTSTWNASGTNTLIVLALLPKNYSAGAAASAGVTTLAALTDVDESTAPTTGQVLTYSGTKWHPATAAAGSSTLAALTDVDETTAPTTGQVLTYSGTKWHPATPAAGGGGSGGNIVAAYDSVGGYQKNVASVTNPNPGTYVITWTTVISADCVPAISAVPASGGVPMVVGFSSGNDTSFATSITIYTQISGTGVNPARLKVAMIDPAAGVGSAAFPAFTPPLASTFAIDLNDGTALSIADDTDVGLRWYIDYATNNPPSGDRIRVKAKAIQTTADWSVTYRQKTTTPFISYMNIGVFLYTAGQPYAVHFGPNTNSTSVSITVNRFNQSGTGYHDTLGGAMYAAGAQEHYGKIEYTHATDALVFSISFDGKTWYKHLVTTGTAACGGIPDHLGVGMGPNTSIGNVGQIGGSISYWNTVGI